VNQNLIEVKSPAPFLILILIKAATRPWIRLPANQELREGIMRAIDSLKAVASAIAVRMVAPRRRPGAIMRTLALLLVTAWFLDLS
jgi:hypothetical protein